MVTLLFQIMMLCFNFDYKNLIKEHIDRKNGLTLVTSKRTFKASRSTRSWKRKKI